MKHLGTKGGKYMSKLSQVDFFMLVSFRTQEKIKKEKENKLRGRYTFFSLDKKEREREMT